MCVLQLESRAGCNASDRFEQAVNRHEQCRMACADTNCAWAGPRGTSQPGSYDIMSSKGALDSAWAPKAGLTQRNSKLQEKQGHPLLDTAHHLQRVAATAPSKAPSFASSCPCGFDLIACAVMTISMTINGRSLKL